MNTASWIGRLGRPGAAVTLGAGGMVLLRLGSLQESYPMVALAALALVASALLLFGAGGGGLTRHTAHGMRGSGMV